MAARAWIAAGQTIAASESLTGASVSCVGARGLCWVAYYDNDSNDATVAIEVSFDNGANWITAFTEAPSSTSTPGFHVRKTWVNDVGGELSANPTDYAGQLGVPGPLARMKVSCPGLSGITVGNFFLNVME